MSRPRTLAAVSLLAVVATLAIHPVWSQSPVVPAVVVPAKSGYLLEIEADATAAVVLVDPPNATFKFFPPSTLFVESAAVKGGVIRVLQVSPGETPTAPRVRWYSWTVGPPVPPAPVILPTAKLSVDPPTVKAIGDEVRRTWATTGADKVTLDGKEVEPNGSDTFQIEQPITLFTLVANDGIHSVYSQQVVSIGELPPPVVPLPSKVDRVTYIWEKDKTAVPRPVAAALNKLNSDSMGKIIASEMEVDTVNGLGQNPPAQYKIAKEAAVKNGLPCLVVQAGDVVIRVVSAPTTLEAVMEAAK